MKKLISGVMIMLLSGQAVFAQGSLTVDDLTVNNDVTIHGNLNLAGMAGDMSSSNLVLYYDFTNSAAPVLDLSGNGNNGSVQGAVWSASGYTNGGCYTFNGVDQWIETGADPATLNLTNQLTILAWIKLSGPITSTYPMIATKQPSSGASDNFSGNLEFRVQPPGVVIFLNQAGGTIEALTGIREVDDGQWHLVGATADAGTKMVQLYIDGALDAQAIMPSTPLSQANTEPVRIGRRKDGFFFSGEIDEPRIYSRVLNSSEMIRMYTSSQLQTNVATLVAEQINQVKSSATNFFMGRVGIGTNVPSEMLDVNGNAVIRGTISGDGAGISNVSASSALVNSELALQLTRATNASKWVENIAGNLSVNPAGYVAVNKLDVSQDTLFRGPVTLGSSLPAGSLSLHFDFNSASAQDLSGNGNNGTLYGSPVWTNNGAKGGTFLFDGINDSVLVNSSASLQLTNKLTLLAWVRTSASGVWSGIICKQPSAGVATSTPGNYEFMLESSGKPRLRFEYDSTAVETITALHAVNDGQWHHVGLTVDAATKAVKFYIDGNLDKSATAVNVPLQKLNNEPVRIGKRKDGCFFIGGIDEPAVYNRVLADGEISSLFSAGKLTAEKIIAGKELWVGGMKVADSNGMLATALPAGVVTNGSSPTFGIITGDGSGLSNIPASSIEGLVGGTTSNAIPSIGGRYIVVPEGTSDLDRGTKLLAAYAQATGMIATAESPVTLIIPPGGYNLDAGALTLSVEYVNIVGMVRAWKQHKGSEFKCDQRIIGTIAQTVGSVRFSDLDVTTYTPISGVINTVIERVRFGTMALDIDFAQTFVSCVGGADSFGSGYDATASGTFIDCAAGNNSFGYVGTASGVFLDCTGGQCCFGHFGAASGVFKNCVAGQASFGSLGTVSGSFVGCVGGDSSFGGEGIVEVFALFENCTFGLDYGPVTTGKVRGCHDSTGALIDNEVGGGADAMLKSVYATGDIWNNQNYVDNAYRAGQADYSSYATRAASAEEGSSLEQAVAKGTNAWEWIQGMSTGEGASDLSMGIFIQGQ